MTVTVLLITYNHERYIRDAVESVLAQETTFDYELVIVEDCSTDATRDIVIEYQKKHPKKIKLILAATNQHNTKAWTAQILQARGRYVAVLDGDDFWTSPHKLQKQVEFLDRHQDCAICFHGTTNFYDDRGHEVRGRGAAQKPMSTVDDLWVGNFMPTSSVMFRAGLRDAFPDWYDRVATSADWALHILNAQHGKIGYIDEVMGAYRQHSGGVWTKLTTIQQLLRVIDFYERMDANLDFAHHTAIDSALHEKGGILLTEIRAARERRDVLELTRGLIGLLRHFPGQLMTECWPSHEPLMLRRYPAGYRIAGRWRRTLERWRAGGGTAAYAGSVDLADSDRIVGWAWDSSRPNLVLDLEVWEGPRLVVRTRADMFRRELRDAGIGKGYHAFYCPLPDQCRDGRLHVLDVKIAGSDFSLERSRVEIVHAASEVVSERRPRQGSAG